MKQFKINAQDYIINDILVHLTNGTVGIGIAAEWDYERIDSNTLVFTLKSGHELKLADLFWFGYLTNQ